MHASNEGHDIRSPLWQQRLSLQIAQGARQDAQYATESMASLKSVCAGPLLAVEEQVNQVAEALASLQEPQASSIWRTPFMATLLPNYSQSRAGASGTPGPQCGGDA